MTKLQAIGQWLCVQCWSVVCLGMRSVRCYAPPPAKARASDAPVQHISLNCMSTATNQAASTKVYTPTHNTAPPPHQGTQDAGGRVLRLRKVSMHRDLLVCYLSETEG